uniref:Uncharacterized protein n=1 Tax=Oryzias latipes TaxID=8090 RepID=A0A3P9JGZ4_ORYLA
MHRVVICSDHTHPLSQVTALMQRGQTTRRSESEAINGSIRRQSIFFFILTLHHCWPPAAVRSLRHGSAQPSPSQLPASAWSKCVPRLTPATVQFVSILVLLFRQ